MSEELNRNEAELNEAALEGVSGGDSPTVEEADRANYCCTTCPRGGGKCGHKKLELAKYIHEHGIIHSYKECPFYKS